VEHGLLLVAILLFNVLQYWWSSQSRVQPVPYSDFERALAQGRVAEVLISEQYLRGELKSPEPGQSRRWSSSPSGSSWSARSPRDRTLAALCR
jgi:FtsH Extracellular